MFNIPGGCTSTPTLLPLILCSPSHRIIVAVVRPPPRRLGYGVPGEDQHSTAPEAPAVADLAPHPKPNTRAPKMPYTPPV